MKRMHIGYRTRFAALLAQLHARRAEQGVQWLLDRAEQLRRQGMPKPQALAIIHDRLYAVVQKFRTMTVKTPLTNSGPTITESEPVRFVCDSGLGGLARWLRAAGYEAFWEPDISDDMLLTKTRRLNAVLLTTDSMLLERRLLRDGIIKSLWLPPTLAVEAQLALVFSELELTLRPARCMSCGGVLQQVDKHAVQDRIPPKTWRWKDEFFLCTRCNKLFWHGTHWERITKRLNKLAAPGARTDVHSSQT